MTSTWSQSAPASSAARISSLSRLKSADRIEGAIFIAFIYGAFLILAAKKPSVLCLWGKAKKYFSRTRDAASKGR